MLRDVLPTRSDDNIWRDSAIGASILARRISRLYMVASTWRDYTRPHDAPHSSPHRLRQCVFSKFLTRSRKRGNDDSHCSFAHNTTLWHKCNALTLRLCSSRRRKTGSYNAKMISAPSTLHDPAPRPHRSR